MGFGEAAADLHHAVALGEPTESPERRALRHQGVGQDRHQVQVLGRLQHAIGDLHGPPMVLAQEVGPRELALERHERRLRVQVGQLGGGRLEEGQRVVQSPPGELGSAKRGRGAGHADPIAALAMLRHGASEQGLGRVVAGGDHSGVTGPLQQLGLLGGVGRDGQGLLDERDRLVVRAERRRALGGRLERDPGLAPERIGLGSLGSVRVGGKIVAGEGSGQLVGS